MNANFGLVAPLEGKFKGKPARQQALVNRALTEIDQLAERLNLAPGTLER
ncbi:MAG: hypothetical protein LRY35_02240 [Clostridiales bacterium]|nr:hypothetical protein [Clostridiales bacterium]